jgi:hypothetical protein
MTLYRLAVPVALGLVRFWFSTCRVVRVLGDDRLPTALARHNAVIPVYWHQHALFAVRYLLEQRSLGLKLGFLISPSVDGEIPAMLVQRAGGVAIRGSSTYTGARALRDYYEAVVRQGVSPGITPDGPRGPRNEFKPGAILLAQLTGRPIVPIAYAASRAYVFRTWDRFVLPWPFSRIVIAVGEPRIVPKGMDADALARWQGELGHELVALEDAARRSLSGA